ncbi:MAG: DNA-3-methyladenine glycosylase 2 family protein [Acidobacteria bacterium]|nr:DNA-3-methyladenine glycosylase 2 family protein [Acidobacteriota bacterium]
MNITIPMPPLFNFKRTALSHGWYDLPPFAFDKASWTLTRVITLNSGKPINVTITAGAGALHVQAPRKLSQSANEKVIRDVRHALRFDDDMTSFYALVAVNEEFAWIAQSGAGRLLRSPGVFEDLVKTICTTNCSWAATDKMVNALVNELGVEAQGGGRTFPTAETMASVDENFYREKIRAGYRAPYLKELAERVTSGELNVEAWLTSELPTDKLKREMQQVKGVGTYAAENLLRLVGRYDGLALDSWVRGKFAKLHNKGRAAEDKKIARYYARFGEWQGLALWCDMTKDWLEGEEKLW